MKKNLFILIIMSLVSVLSMAETGSKELITIPIMGSSPETGFLLGGVGAYIKSGKEREINFNLGGFYTAKKQSNIFLQNQIQDSKGKTKLEFTYQNWLADYYGLGNNTILDDKVAFEKRGFDLKIGRSKNLNKSNLIGFILSYEDFSIDIENGSELESPEGTNLAGIGLKYEFDTRDREYNTGKGKYFLCELINYSDLDELRFIKSNFDYRVFKTLTKDHVVGVHANLILNKGDVPFQKLESLGEQDLLRGYLGERYLEENKFASQVEYRYPIYKKVSGVFFGGIGEVFNDKFKIDELKSSYGVGIRYNLSKEQGINLRFDYAFGEDENQFYINIGEAF